MTDKIQIEVAYATPDKQLILSLHVALGTTVYQAAELSGIVNEFPEIQLSEAKMGLFGKGVRNPQEEVLREMDRVEIYRPLTIDPKVARANRAATAAKKAAADKEAQNIAKKVVDDTEVQNLAKKVVDEQ
ncbi:RnfH family protein [Bermanella sp. 47_1433_sub80_T6]|nr:RnfH family protein [Bermanella sp. 47_1433_sub80_T6]